MCISFYYFFFNSFLQELITLANEEFVFASFQQFVLKHELIQQFVLKHELDFQQKCSFPVVYFLINKVAHSACVLWLTHHESHKCCIYKNKRKYVSDGCSLT